MGTRRVDGPRPPPTARPMDQTRRRLRARRAPHPSCISIRTATICGLDDAHLGRQSESFRREPNGSCHVRVPIRLFGRIDWRELTGFFVRAAVHPPSLVRACVVGPLALRPLEEREPFAVEDLVHDACRNGVRRAARHRQPARQDLRPRRIPVSRSARRRRLGRFRHSTRTGDRMPKSSTGSRGPCRT